MLIKYPRENYRKDDTHMSKQLLGGTTEILNNMAIRRKNLLWIK